MDTTTAVLSPERRVDLLEPLRRLLAQLSPSIDALSDDVLAQRFRDDRLVLVVAQHDQVLVATATLSVAPTASHGLVGHVDDVVVDEARGGGVGRLLMEAVHAEARRLGLQHLDLTSRPAREAANALYQSLGYERRDTNVYRLGLQP